MLRFRRVRSRYGKFRLDYGSFFRVSLILDTGLFFIFTVVFLVFKKVFEKRKFVSYSFFRLF